MIVLNITNGTSVSNHWDGNDNQLKTEYPVIVNREHVATLGIVVKTTGDHEKQEHDPSEQRGTPEYALEAIVRNIRNSPDPFVAAGEWITKVTQAIVSETERKEHE